MNVLSIESRRVKQALHARKARVLDLAIGPIEPVGEPVLIQPLEKVEVLRRTCVSGEVIVLVSWRDVLYLVTEDLEERTMRVFGSWR